MREFKKSLAIVYAFQASAAATAAAQQVAALAEAMAPLQQRLAALEQQPRAPAGISHAATTANSNAELGDGQAAGASAAAAPAAADGHHLESSDDGGTAADEQLAQLEQRLLSRLERKLGAGGRGLVGGNGSSGKRRGCPPAPRSAPCSRRHSPQRQRCPIRHRAWRDEVDVSESG